MPISKIVVSIQDEHAPEIAAEIARAVNFLHEGTPLVQHLLANPFSAEAHELLSDLLSRIDAADNTAVPPDEIDLDEDGDTGGPIPFDLAAWGECP